MFLTMLKQHPLGHPYQLGDLVFLKNLHGGAKVVAQETLYTDFSRLLVDFWKVISHEESLFESRVLDKFDELACKRLTNQWVTVFHSTLFDEVFLDDQVRIIAWCICLRLNQYVKKKWQPNTYSHFLKLQWSSLGFSLPSARKERDLDKFATPIFNDEMIRFLLDHGVSPNEGYEFLCNVASRRYLGVEESDQSSEEIRRIEKGVLKAVEILIDAGLDLPPGAQKPSKTSSRAALNEANFQDRTAAVFGERQAHMLHERYEQRHS